ncbi:ribosomal protein L32 [Methylacidiphilum kamchatkense Kam1]|uniref:Large ribosomal subunit protein bL32 n=1 Tax=Methylacidiphilum kamchatkense Kam1 TaxID=1202785 RepID=A0A0C1V2U7_9BACT|nr:50S ribosomal protein L32 [Methylacidiphilum kamchatkense]KIE57995.1 ribosomal protein L32 [Methylacidiphilum kamchatkense Kam1]QDQ42432.1 LSU ribosomal protein L32P [Methylacidiphilum kamchatkense Kam1]
MGVPKRITSKARKRSRKAANRWTPPGISKDKKTGNWVKSHHVDPATGMYNGRQVLTQKTTDEH